jgi:hypothetical protein
VAENVLPGFKMKESEDVSNGDLTCAAIAAASEN